MLWGPVVLEGRGVPRMGGPTEAERPRNRECPLGKREPGDHGSPRVSSPWKEAARGKGRDKAVPHRNGVRGKGLLSAGWQRKGLTTPERAHRSSPGERVQPGTPVEAPGAAQEERPPRCFLPPLLSLCSGRFPGPPVPVQPSPSRFSPARPNPSRLARGYLQEKASGCRSPMMERRSARDGAGGTGRTAQHGSARLRQETGAGGSAFPPGGGAGRGPRPRTGYVKRSGAAGGGGYAGAERKGRPVRPSVLLSVRLLV